MAFYAQTCKVICLQEHVCALKGSTQFKSKLQLRSAKERGMA